MLSESERREIERAKRIGTFGKVDRSPQYAGPERARPEALLNAVNCQGNAIRSLEKELTAAVDQIRSLQKELAAKDSRIADLESKLEVESGLKRRYHIITIALTSILTSLAWKGMETLMGK